MTNQQEKLKTAEKHASVIEALTSSVTEIRKDGNTIIGPSFQLSCALAELILDDPGASEKTKKTAKKVLDKYETALREVANRVVATAMAEAEKVAG